MGTSRHSMATPTPTAPAPAMEAAPTPPATTGPYAEEISGVNMARAAALTSLIGLLLVLSVPLLFYFTLSVNLPLLGHTVGSGTLTVTLLEEMLGLVLAGIIVSLVSVVLYVVAFNSLRKVHNGFGAPMGLTIVGLVGFLLILAGIGLALVTVLQAVGCAASGAASGCISLGTLAVGVYAALGGAFLAFIGWIGLLIGIYRIGKTYRSTATKVGAILYILPFISTIAPLIVFVGIHGIAHRLNRTVAGSA